MPYCDKMHIIYPSGSWYSTECLKIYTGHAAGKYLYTMYHIHGTIYCRTVRWNSNVYVKFQLTILTFVSFGALDFYFLILRYGMQSKKIHLYMLVKDEESKARFRPKIINFHMSPNVNILCQVINDVYNKYNDVFRRN